MIAPPILLWCRHAVMLGVMLGCTGITQAPRRVARGLPVTRRHQLRLPTLPVDLPGNRLHQRPVHVSLRSASAHHGGWRAARVHRPRRHAVVSSPPDRTRLPGGPDRRSLWNELLVSASSPPGLNPPPPLLSAKRECAPHGPRSYACYTALLPDFVPPSSMGQVRAPLVPTPPLRVLSRSAQHREEARYGAGQDTGL